MEVRTIRGVVRIKRHRINGRMHEWAVLDKGDQRPVVGWGLE